MQLDGWWQLATGTAQALHGQMSALDDTLDQILRYQADPTSFDPHGRLVTEGLEDALTRLRNDRNTLLDRIDQLVAAGRKYDILLDSVTLPH